jgi:hypothetical protein
MSIPRVLACLSLLAAPMFAIAQTSPTIYTITETMAGGTPGTTEIIYRLGDKALTDMRVPAQGATPAGRTLTLYDLKAQTTISWNPAANPPVCGGAGNFSGDWGDPFAMTADVKKDIASGEVKPAGTETVDGLTAQIYYGSSSQGTEKVWLDEKDGLVLRADVGAPGQPTMRWVDITKISLAAPDPAMFALPAVCAGVKPPPTPAQIIAEETGDDPGNYVTAFVGPGSKDSCNVVLRVVQAKTLAPLTNVQVAIDTQYDQNDPNPPHYNFGVADSGRETFSGGHLRDLSAGVHNGVVSLGAVPSYFNLVVNAVHPGHSGGSGLIYRQCFAPTTVLLFLYKNYGQSDESVDAVWVKSGKYAAAAH